VEFNERKNSFIKCDIMRDIDSPFREIQTLEPFMHVTIPKEHTTLGTKLEFPGIIGPQVWPNRAPESTEKAVVRLLIVQAFIWCLTINHFRWKAVNEKNSSEECLVPEFQRHARMSEKSESHFNDVSMFPLS